MVSDSWVSVKLGFLPIHGGSESGGWIDHRVHFHFHKKEGPFLSLSHEHKKKPEAQEWTPVIPGF